MDTLSKPNLEQMLSFLDLATLESIDSKYRQDAYLYGSRPLLRYTPEALKEYASVLYRHILPHFGAIIPTEEEYIALWLAPYTTLQAQLKAKEVDFIDTLVDIVTCPIPETDPHILITPDECLYAQIANFLSKKDTDLFADIIDFFCNTFSPLRKDDVTDPRVIALVAEVDTLRDTVNVALKVLIDTEFKRLIQSVNDRLAYYKLRSSRIALLTAHKAKIPASDWATISAALESRVVTAEVKALISSGIKIIKQALAQIKSEEPVDTIGVNDVFICTFLQQLEQVYSNLVPVTSNVTLDDIFADIDAIYLAQVQNTNFNAIQDLQKFTEDWYYDYHNISQSLSVSLQIALNNISPSTVLSPDVLSHGAVKGMIAFAEQINAQQKSGTRYFDYDKLAQELRHQLRVHTLYFTDTTPLPELVSIGREQLLNAQESTIQQAKLADTSFDITKPIQQSLNNLRPTMVLTEYKEVFLSDVEIQSLVPIPDHTITELLLLFAGKGTTPYILNGDLLACTKGCQYIKIVPEIDKAEGYASYKFTAVNGKVLNWLVNKYCELLQAIPEYDKLIGYYRDPGDELFGITPEYDYNTEGDSDYDDYNDGGEVCTLQKLNDLLKARMHSTQIHLSLSGLSERLDSQASCYWEDDALLKCLASTVEWAYRCHGLEYHVPFKKYYDPPYRISGHYLMEWMYEREEYTKKITNGGGAYQVDHVKRGVEYRSDNSKENLRIKPTGYNLGRTSRSIEVAYNGDEYVSLFIYNKDTNAGSYDTLLDLKDTLQPGESKVYNKRIYTKVDEHQLVATDAELNTPPVEFNGKTYDTLKDFAKAYKLKYALLRNLRSITKKEGKSEFKHKKFVFFLLENNCIKVTC